jgi:hypothetical protein
MTNLNDPNAQNGASSDPPVLAPLMSAPLVPASIVALEHEIQQAQERLERNKRDSMLWLVLSTLSFFILLAIFSIYFPILIADTPRFDIWMRIALSMLIALFLFIWGVLARQRRLSASEEEVEAIKTKKSVMDRVAQSKPTDKESDTSRYFKSLVEINILYLKDYYSLVKVHTDKSYIVATLAGMIGFGFIIVGLIVGLAVSFTGNENAQIIAYLTSASGIITEFIAGIFFYLYNKTVRQLKEYHDSLLDVQNILLSFKIVGDTSDVNERTKMVTQMITALLPIKHSNE